MFKSIETLFAQDFASYSDGTLITQRFHFTSEPHPHRHVLGWYRLARELNDNGVQAVCVFDGKERSYAKVREVYNKARTPLFHHLTVLIRTKEGAQYVA